MGLWVTMGIIQDVESSPSAGWITATGNDYAKTEEKSEHSTTYVNDIKNYERAGKLAQKEGSKVSDVDQP